MDISTAYSSDEKIKKTLRVSFWDGAFASGMTGFTAEYFTPFLLFIGGSVRHVGILNALQNLSASLTQFKSADLTAFLKSRKVMFSLFVFLQALALLPIVWVAYFCSCTPVFFIIFVVLFAGCGAFALSPWGSLMSDLVPAAKRGVYFGWRNKIIGFIGVGATFLAGFILYHVHRPRSCFGFVIIFSGAFIFRLISLFFLLKMHETPLHHKKEDQFTLFMFLSRLKESNFAQFVIFVALINFSVNLAAPFFAVFMLKDLSFSYVLYAAITVTATLTICFAIGRWGRLSDRVGNLKILKVTAPLISIVPLFWIFNQQPLFLFFAQIFSGFAWAGFNLCASNFIYDAVTPEKRTRCISYFNLLNGLALFLGSFIGGFILPHLPDLMGHKILMLFLISSLLRLGVSIFGSRSLKEVRPVEHMSRRDLFLNMVIIPVPEHT